ncbi:MAG TPA: tetratricopeptide repeat protein [Candidatus Saccharimonadales bacterium]|nr:tetratricopeptide repeat protein [Candidatus Saccharimonadales bacterium]
MASLLKHGPVNPYETTTLLMAQAGLQTGTAADYDIDRPSRLPINCLVNKQMPTEINPIEPPDNHHLSAAIGWLELGNPKEANEELKKIAPALHSHSSVLIVRHEIYTKGQQWDLADEIARQLLQLFPEEPQFWIWHAYSTRRMRGGGIPQAKEILGKAQQLFPDEALIVYNLACYDCQLGNLKEARAWLEKAFHIGDRKVFKAMALQDRDLEPMWAEIKEI